MSDSGGIDVNSPAASVSGEPSERVRRRLVVLLGESPAVLTETVWALLHEEPAWIPDEIYAVTSSEGMRIALEGDPLQRSLDRLWAMLRCDRSRLLLPEESPAIEFPTSGQTHPPDFDDSKSLAWLYVALGRILDRKAAGDPRTEIHLSVSGGRKGQGALAAIVAQSFWQEGDRLSQIMVLPKGIENAEGFDAFRFPGDQSIQPFNVSLSGGARTAVPSGRVDIRLVEIPVLPGVPDLAKMKDLFPLPGEPEAEGDKADEVTLYRRARRYYEMSWKGSIHVAIHLSNIITESWIELSAEGPDHWKVKVLAHDNRWGTKSLVGQSATIYVTTMEFAYLVWSATRPQASDEPADSIAYCDFRYWAFQEWAREASDWASLLEKSRIIKDEWEKNRRTFYRNSVHPAMMKQANQKWQLKGKLKTRIGGLGEKVLEQLDSVGHDIACTPELSDEMVGDYNLLLSWP